MKKSEIAKQFLRQHLQMFKCPVCGEPFEQVLNGSLLCPNQHSYDVSKKGTLYFLNHGVPSEYNHDMLSARHDILTAGLFDGIIDAVVAEMSPEPQTILDVGTGEGTPLAKLLAKRQQPDTAVGFDISKDGINLATNLKSDAFFCIADLAHLPFEDRQFSTILEFFSPSAYDEFDRVTTSNAKLIKVVPNAHYLFELRQSFFDEEDKRSTYSNEAVVERLVERYTGHQIKRIPVKYQWQVLPSQLPALITMTPLHWNVDEDRINATINKAIKQITVDVTVLVVDL